MQRTLLSDHARYRIIAAMDPPDLCHPVQIKFLSQTPPPSRAR